MGRIDEKRERIREIDEQICELLTKRAETAKTLAEIKRRRGQGMTDGDQETAVIERAEDWMDGFDNVASHVPRIFREIIEFTKTQMKT